MRQGAAMVDESTLTVVFGGDVPLDLYAESMLRFRRLVDALTQEVSGGVAIDWVLDELSAGGAVATIRGKAEHVEDVKRVVQAYATIGQALERHEVIPYSPKVARAAEALASVLNGKIASIRFETPSTAATVTAGTADQGRAYLAAYGAIEGRIEPPRSQRSLRFTLYDSLNDEAVKCLLYPEQAELVRDAWSRRVMVEGWIKREPTSGRPVEVNPVEAITVLPDIVPGSYRTARGVAPARPDAPSTEEVIRRLRDAG